MKDSMSLDERAAAGKAARAAVPRSSHATWEPAKHGRDPVDVLQEQAQGRVAELVPIRYGRMLASPFAFFRGAAAIMAMDLASTAQCGLEVQLSGDAHLSNFGVFAGPDRRLVFDCNDFDETLPGPFEWDVKRLAASIAIAGRDLGFGKKKRRAAIVASLREYRETMRHFARMRDLDVWYARLDVADAVERLRPRMKKRGRKLVEKTTAKAEHKDSLRAFDKLTRSVNGQTRIVSDPPLITPVEEFERGGEVEAELTQLVDAYRQTLESDRRHLVSRYHYRHAARKVVGVGSVGTRAWILLFLGRDDRDPLFFQAKEATSSVLEPHVGKSRFRHHGRRVVEGQRLMQATGDSLLGWVTVASGLDGRERDFYVRQLWDEKGSINLEHFKPRELAHYGALCGWALARAHARSGDRVALAAYLGSGAPFDKAIADFAEAYADQNQLDYDRLVAAAMDGRIEVERGI